MFPTIEAFLKPASFSCLEVLYLSILLNNNAFRKNYYRYFNVISNSGHFLHVIFNNMLGVLSHFTLTTKLLLHHHSPLSEEKTVAAKKIPICTEIK